MLLRPPAAADVVAQTLEALAPFPSDATAARLPAAGAQAVAWELTEPVRLTRFIARRLAKTALLEPLREPGTAAMAEQVLARIAAYVAAAGTSFGSGEWNPPVDRQGTMVRETDLSTGAHVVVACTSRRPLRFSATVELPALGVISWEETSAGQRLGLGCVTVPAEVEVTFAGGRGGPLAGYVATISGRLSARVSPRLGPWVVRASGELVAHDSCAGVGRIELDPSGELRGRFIASDGTTATVAGAVSHPEIEPAGGVSPSGVMTVPATRLAA